MPKLSVIVPVYNTEKYLRECIDSILGQTFTDFELILVDDGSTDSSGAICDEYAQMDERIHVIHQKNGGITVARKSGVRHATGEYVTFVDSDDWIHKDMYRIMLTQEAADVRICNLVKATSTGMFEMSCFAEPGHYDKRKLEAHFYPTMLFDYDHCQPAVHPSLCNKLIRTEIIRNVIVHVDDSITYGEDASNQQDVPQNAFVIFELKRNSSRIGSLTISENGVYKLSLRSEYQFNWENDLIEVTYEQGTDSYSTTIADLKTLVNNTDIKLIKEITTP